MAMENEDTRGMGRDRCQNVWRIDEREADAVARD